MARDKLLDYTWFNKQFDINTDVRNFQLGAVISQGVRTIAFFGRKLNGPHTRYTTTENKLLRILETLK